MKTVLDILRGYEVELDNDRNNLANIDVVRAHVNSGLYFVYKLLSTYKHLNLKHDSNLRAEVLLVGIEAERIACKLLNNYVRLRLLGSLITRSETPPCVLDYVNHLALKNVDKAHSLSLAKILDKVRELTIEFKDRVLYKETIITPEYFVSKGGSFYIERLVSECNNMVEEYEQANK